MLEVWIPDGFQLPDLFNVPLPALLVGTNVYHLIHDLSRNTLESQQQNVPHPQPNNGIVNNTRYLTDTVSTVYPFVPRPS